MPGALARTVRARARRWLLRPGGAEPGEVFLSRRRVYIVPTGAGFGFAALLLVLLVGSINYNLALGYALTFGAGACAMVDMLFTYRNLAHLHLRPGRARSVFAGEDARFEFELHNRTGRDRYALRVGFAEAGAAPQLADAAAGASAVVQLGAPSAQRGWLPAPRIRLATRFPLGLFRAWSYWHSDLRALVYPFPEAQAEPLPAGAGAAGHGGQGGAGNDDFAGIRGYQPGDPMRHLAWRQIARLDPALGGQLVTKQFDAGAADELVLDFDALPLSMDLELRLSRMTRWVLEAERRAVPYALRVGALRLAASAGAAHQEACLRALALYGLAGEAP